MSSSQLPAVSSKDDHQPPDDASSSSATLLYEAAQRRYRSRRRRAASMSNTNFDDVMGNSVGPRRRGAGRCRTAQKETVRLLRIRRSFLGCRI